MAVKYTGFYNIADSDYFRVLDAVFNNSGLITLVITCCSFDFPEKQHVTCIEQINRCCSWLKVYWTFFRHKIEWTLMPNKIKEWTERLFFFFCQQISLRARNHHYPDATKSVFFCDRLYLFLKGNLTLTKMYCFISKLI